MGAIHPIITPKTRIGGGIMDKPKVGLYARLSKDDRNASSESMSIKNQCSYIADFLKERGWAIEETYIDDGYTGMNFDRPDVKRLLKDIGLGRINT